MKCDMIGCKEKAIHNFSTAPGTFLKLCKKCFDEYKKEEERNE